MSDSQKKISKVYVLSHTHWDREWYQDFQGFRQRLVYMMDELIDHMEGDEAYRYFMLDGQTIILDDYIRIRPERRERLAKLIADGRIQIGPWYVMPDEFLVSGESLIRNLLKGIRESRKWGAEPVRSGYVTDIFGHNSQLPQLLQGFGIDHAVMFRGFRGDKDPSELWWEGADGSRVLGLKLDEDRAYSDFYFAVRWPFFERDDDYAGHAEELVQRAQQYLAFKNERATTDIAIGMDGVDHVEIEPQLAWLLRMLTEETGVEFVHATIEQYTAELRSKINDLKVHKGEQRALGFSGINNWVPENVLSSRIHLKQNNQYGENLLEKWAEPLGVMTAALGKPYPAGFLSEAWAHLLQNHPHDSICGCSINQVHRDMIYRFDQARLIGEGLVKESLQYVVNHLNETQVDGKQVLAVFNMSQSAIDGIVEIELSLPAGSDASLRMADHNLQGTSFRLFDGERREIAYQVLSVQREHAEMYRPYRELPRARVSDVYRLAIHAKVPSFGYTAYTVEPFELDWHGPLEFSAPKLVAPVRHPGTQRIGARAWDNGRIRLEVRPDGTLDITEAATGHTFRGLLRFEDEGDIGDGWTHMAPIGNERFTSSGPPAQLSVVYDGPYATCLRIRSGMRLPAGVDASGTRRSDAWTDFAVTTFITLLQGDAKVYCRTVVDNAVRDHRFGVWFPTGLDTDSYAASTPFDLVKRPFREPDRSDYLRKPYEAFPHNGILAANDGKAGLAIYSKGLYEVCLRDDEDRALWLTLFRSTAKEVGTDPGDGGQQLRTMTFEYAIEPFRVEEQFESKLWLAHQRYAAGIRTAERPAGRVWRESPYRRDANLPLSSSFLGIAGAGLQVSAVKAAEEGDNRWIVRIFNTTDLEASGRLICHRALAEVHLLNLNEETLEKLKTDRSEVAVKAGPRQIITVGLVWDDTL
ncbi:glycoside hydrolase family 38 C-terminal domain-containing protein [Cohnella sp. GbtcB17]|uniref:glycoside hydrolase family 38 N-terminal domain-containing protein n=1 Tax=Cohnella sp. GbtcB17 TaxID=2824762 RepID=UPI001C30AAD5|nr:glycoside hydrolase family 38 C-terminal domain-containing protein [Cohnella sp. GbtcB17]